MNANSFGNGYASRYCPILTAYFKQLNIVPLYFVSEYRFVWVQKEKGRNHERDGMYKYTMARPHMKIEF